MKISNLKFQILFLFTIYYLLFAIGPALAQTMSNEGYKLEMGNFNSIAGESSGSNYGLNITSGETAPGFSSAGNYKIRTGFQYIPRGTAFSLSISNNLIDFGTLSPTNPVTRTSIVTINNGSAPGYQVRASQNHPLLVQSTGARIPDTTCDDGKCSEEKASEWSSTLTYGFGYSCNSISIFLDDSKSTNCQGEDLFRQFADISRGEPQSIIIKGAKGKNQKATITYKVNIASSQPAGLYTNSVTYILVPTF